MTIKEWLDGMPRSKAYDRMFDYMLNYQEAKSRDPRELRRSTLAKKLWKARHAKET